ncbi:MAG: DUF4450 domain-containing protein [Paludibacter sp.]|nr:DUF4450 domain-containing protein [Paludibacter sp.]
MNQSTKILFTISCLFILLLSTVAQEVEVGKKVYDPELNQMVEKNVISTERILRYTPDGEDFVIVNGDKKFNRALYGTNTGFRVETGDVPEFALYLPHMGGNLSFYIKRNKKGINLNDADRIECRYRAGSRIYEITDLLLGKGSIKITALAMSTSEGIILKVETKNIPFNTELSWRFGGCADKRFSREGDLGVDPADCFYLKPEYCKGNEFAIKKNNFEVIFGAKKDKKLIGSFPEKSKLEMENSFPFLKGKMKICGTKTYYFAIKVPNNENDIKYSELSSIFQLSEIDRKKIASQIKIITPDAYFNTLGSTLSTAADGIWSGETWLHGAVGWRMPLSGWRAAYTGDVLGWHDRARKHFDAYAVSQVTNIEPVRPHPTQDSALHLARAEKSWGTQMYSNGYICRNPNRNDQMHHYDMNLCYIDELLWHLNWTGDLEYAKRIWPVIESSLAWEKRNYDPDNDGLYDAYCCIWASDALYYSSGAVTHSSAYNYRANKVAAEIASKIGIDPQPYTDEASKIYNAINDRLWLKNKGHWAEYQDYLGEKKLHESAAVWTIYHAIDSEVQDAFQGYQATRYLDTNIPHIPVIAKGLIDEGYQTISTSDWMPYSWSINNVAFAEVMNTALAYWEAGRSEAGFKLLKSSILDGMYIGSSPGNVGQISYYDAARGECYRDFGDPIGVLSRTLVQGLYGITPDAMNDKMVIKPGFPQKWEYASLETPDIQFYFKRKNNTDSYKIKQHFSGKLNIELQLRASKQGIKSVKLNGQNISWELIQPSIEFPILSLEIPYLEDANIEINWDGQNLENKLDIQQVIPNSDWHFKTMAKISGIFDPQKVLEQIDTTSHSINAKITSKINGFNTFFVELNQGEMTWWQPVNLQVTGNEDDIPSCTIPSTGGIPEMINIDSLLNDSVTNIFNNRYFSPRSPFTTLQIPTQGIGEWCHPLTTASIDDSGLRKIAAENNNTLNTGFDIFRTSSKGRNIAFTSRWDNFPRKIEIPLSGKARKASFMLAGTTNHMQTHFVNGLITVEYTDDTNDTLKLINPENWCPIEQDYYEDGLAFKINAERPYRVHLKSGLLSNNLEEELNIEGVYGRKIDGGAAELLDMKLDKNKTLRKISIETSANDVIIGLMSLTLER